MNKDIKNRLDSLEAELDQVAYDDAPEADGTEMTKKFRLVPWMQAKLWIVDKFKKLVLLRLKPAQKRLAALVVLCWYIGIACEFVILKSRQLGFSTEIEGFSFAFAENIPLTEAALIANATDNTKKVFGITECYFDKYPQAAAKGAKFLRRVLAYPDPHRSKITIATAGSPNAGASGTTNFVHLSEYGLFPNAEDSWQAMYPAWPQTPGSFFFTESTGRPDAYDYKALWDASFKHNPDHPIKTYLHIMECYAKGITPRIGIFESWLKDNEARIPLLPGEKLNLDERDVELQKEFNTDLEQMKWWDNKWRVGFKGNRARALVEFPWKPEHPFQYYGGPAYDQIILGSLRANAKPPIFLGEVDIDKASQFVKPILEAKEFGKLRIWEHPISGELYVVAVDSAQGTGVGDFNEIVVAKVGKNGKKHKVTAHFRTNEQNFGPNDNAAKAWFLGIYYNQALVISENNAINQGAIKTFIDGHARYSQTIQYAPYPFLYSYVQKDRETQEEREEIGFRSGAGSKQMAVADLAETIHAGMWEIDSVELIDQLMGFHEDPLKRGRDKFHQTFKDPITSKPHDDGCDCQAMAEQGCRWVIANDFPSIRTAA